MSFYPSISCVVYNELPSFVCLGLENPVRHPVDMIRNIFDDNYSFVFLTPLYDPIFPEFSGLSVHVIRS